MPYDGTITISDPNLVTTFTHEDGSKTFILIDLDGENANPRHNDGNVSTLIQRNDRRGDIDTDDEGLSEARDRWGNREDMIQRYIAIWHPEVLYYCDYWSGRDLYGWGYVTRTDWAKAMGEGYHGDVTPELAFDQEVDVYRQWADGEVYGFIHIRPDGTEDSCWGFLGYKDHREIAEQATGSPITEED